MHLPSGFTPLVAFLALLAKTTAKDSAPFELKSHVLHPPNPSLDGLYFIAPGYHPGPFFFGALGEPSDAYPALVSVLTGTAGNRTLVTNSIDGFGDALIAIEPGSTDTPAAYDSVQLIPGVPTTYGLHFVNDVLKWKDVKGSFYGKIPVPLRSL